MKKNVNGSFSPVDHYAHRIGEIRRINVNDIALRFYMIVGTRESTHPFTDKSVICVMFDAPYHVFLSRPLDMERDERITVARGAESIIVDTD